MKRGEKDRFFLNTARYGDTWLGWPSEVEKNSWVDLVESKWQTNDKI